MYSHLWKTKWDCSFTLLHRNFHYIRVYHSMALVHNPIHRTCKKDCYIHHKNPRDIKWNEAAERRTITTQRPARWSLEIKKFDSKSVSWQEFWEQFGQIIHKNGWLMSNHDIKKSAVTGTMLPKITPPYKRTCKSSWMVIQYLHLCRLKALDCKQDSCGTLLYPLIQWAPLKEILLEFNRVVAEEEALEITTPRTKWTGSGTPGQSTETAATAKRALCLCSQS